MRWRYPRFRIKQRRDGWHIWWIPACDPIRRIHVADTFEDAVAHIDYLQHREPS